MIHEDKALLRRQVRGLLSGLSPREAAARSRAAARAFRSLPEYRSAGLLLAFLSLPGEIDTAPLVDEALASGLPLGVPRISGGEIAFVRLDPAWRSWPRDRFGIPEPPASSPEIRLSDYASPPAASRRPEGPHPSSASAEGGLILVASPGLAFSPSGARLGRGKGYYDRFLRRSRAEAALGGFRLLAAGYSYALQVFPELPAGPEDEAMDWLVNEGGCFRVGLGKRSEASGEGSASSGPVPS